MSMYRVIENQHLASLRQTAGPVMLLCEDGRPAILRQLLAGVAHLRAHADPTAATANTPEALARSLGERAEATGWLVPVRVWRSRFSRGDDWGSRWSRQLGAKGTP